MDVTVTTWLIIAFFMLGEFLTWVLRKNDTFSFSIITIVRVCTMALSLLSLNIVSKENYKDLKEANDFKAEVLKAYDTHYDNVEALLDSIYSWDDSFMDTVGETDTYYYYVVSREKVDSLYKTQE